tara:strand:- start:14359 stop:16653 length:2295 start_codon:yes stop_codon:yes gene_type:complete
MTPNGLISGRNRGVAYDVPNSGAFASEQSDYLYRTPSTAGNSQVGTLSFHVKLSQAGLDTTIFQQRDNVDVSMQTRLYFIGDKLRFLTQDVTTTGLYDSDSLFRDTANSYHIVVAIDTTQAVETDRLRVWSNNTLLTFTTPTNMALNLSLSLSKAVRMLIGAQRPNSSATLNNYMDGYLSEYHFVDGQALTPDNFAETDTRTGQWVAKAYAGTYGTNGFYLNFQNGANLGEDSSGNGNNFTNSGVTQSTDTPTDNHAILNSLQTGLDVSTSSAGLKATRAGGVGVGTYSGLSATAGVSSGKYYWEVEITYTSTFVMAFGVVQSTYSFDGTGANSVVGHGVDSVALWVQYNLSLSSYIGGVITDLGVGIPASGSIIGFRYDNGDIYASLNGVDLNGGASLLTVTSEVVPCSVFRTFSTNTYRFAEPSWTYTPPAGFLALSTKNLPEPAIIKPNQYFKALAYDDGAGAKTVGFQPDLVWMKSRGSAFNHKLVDSVRGATKAWSSDSETAGVTEATGLTSFDTNGFTVGADTDYSDTTGTGMIAWNWKESVIAGMDIVRFSGTGVAQSISHSLGVVPQVMFVRATTVATGALVYHQSNTASPATQYVNLVNTAATATQVAVWNNTAPTSTQFTVGVSGGVNASGTDNCIAYLFAEIEGFSKFNKYTGNGSVDGPFIHCGFRPAYVMIKRSDVVGDWVVIDTTRSASNLAKETLNSNTTAVEVTVDNEIDILSNGFKCRVVDADINANTGTYIFLAFAEHPFKYSRAR